MNRRTVSLRLLQLFSSISATVALAAGGTIVFGGMRGIVSRIGLEYPAVVPMLESAIAGIDPEAAYILSTWYRVLGWYWLVAGLMLFWIIPKIEYQGAWFRLIHLAFMSVGIANWVSIVQYGPNALSRYGGVAIELGIPAAAILWQWIVARAATEAR